MAKLLYEVLKVEENANTSEIRAAWKKLADINNERDKDPRNKDECAAQRAILSKARDILGHKNKRKQYDDGLINEQGELVEEKKEKNEKKENKMDLYTKYLDFLHQAIKDFEHVKGRVKDKGSMSRPEKEKYNKFLDEKSRFLTRYLKIWSLWMTSDKTGRVSIQNMMRYTPNSGRVWLLHGTRFMSLV